MPSASQRGSRTATALALVLEDLEQDVERTDSNMQMMQKKLGSLVEQTKASDKAM